MILLRPARILDVYSIHVLRRAAAAELTRQYGWGPWSKITISNTLRRAIAGGTLFVFGEHAATCTLDREDPAFYAKLGFSEPEAPAFYLRSMSVHPDVQGQGTGRALLNAVEKRARAQGVAFVRLDAYAGPAGAGGFYTKCGYVRIFTRKHKGEELEFYEKRLL